MNAGRSSPVDDSRRSDPHLIESVSPSFERLQRFVDFPRGNAPNDVALTILASYFPLSGQIPRPKTQSFVSDDEPLPESSPDWVTNRPRKRTSPIRASYDQLRYPLDKPSCGLAGKQETPTLGRRRARSFRRRAHGTGATPRRVA